MNAKTAMPLKCALKYTQTQAVFITKVTMPTVQTGQKECKKEKSEVSLNWDYSVDPVGSDRQCVYVDGRFYQKFTTESPTKVAKSVSDTRPLMGHGKDRVQLVSHFTWEEGYAGVEGSKTDDWPAKNPSGFEMLEDASRVVHNTGKGTYILNNQPSMESSAVMTWIKISSEKNTTTRKIPFGTLGPPPRKSTTKLSELFLWIKTKDLV
jgi:hypothetical protein